MAGPVGPLSDLALALCFASTLVVPLAGAGLALINTGLGRSRSAAHSMVASLCVVAIAAVTYVVCGFAFQGYSGGPAHALVISGREWNYLAAGRFFLRGLALNGSPASLAVLLQIFTVGLAALIPLGSGGDRWRLGAICASTAILAGWTYPLFAHWVWGGGWLAQLGANYRLGRGFIDTGGASTIQAVGGVTALAITCILGPRRGKYDGSGPPGAIPGHSVVLCLFGCVLAWIGWIGLNAAGALLFAGSEPGGVVLVALNTTVSAGAAALAAVLMTRLRFGKPDASLVANGWVGGLVASSAVSAFVTPAITIVVGLIAGGVITLSVEWLDRIEIDDPAGAVSVHALGGIWGVLAVGLFAPGRTGPGQMLAQVIGVATLLGAVLPLTYSLNYVLNLLLPQRVSADGERQGLDLHELGAGAYPEFATLGDEFTQR